LDELVDDPDPENPNMQQTPAQDVKDHHADLQKTYDS
jgi:hypothetical protein